MYHCSRCGDNIRANELHGAKGNKHFCLRCIRELARAYQEKTLIALLKV